MIFDLTILILLLTFSALYAGSEIVFVVVNKLRVELKVQQNIYTAKIALDYLNNPKEFLIISLVGTNIFHIAFSSTFAIIINNNFLVEPYYVMLMTAFLILVFSEIIPKVYFRENSDKFVYSFAIILLMSKIIFSPILALINLIINFIMKYFKVSETAERLSYTREDIYNLIKSRQMIENKSDEISYFIRSLELLDRLVKEIMIPRTEIIAVSKDSDLKEILDKIIDSDLDTIMLFEDNIDNIVGYIQISDLLEQTIKVEKVIKPVLYVPETLKCSELLLKFQKEQKFISVIVDEFGGTAGLVTFENILEEIIGNAEIPSKFEDILNKKIDDNVYILNGRIELDQLNEKYQLNINSDAAFTLGGFIIAQSGRVPKVGEIVQIGKYTFKILKGSKTRIELVELKIEK